MADEIKNFAAHFSLIDEGIKRYDIAFSLSWNSEKIWLVATDPSIRLKLKKLCGDGISLKNPFISENKK